MEWQSLIALMIVISLILFPAVFIWSVTIGGIYTAIKEAHAKRVAHQAEAAQTRQLVENK